MPDLDNQAEFSNKDSVPLIPLGIKPPAIDSVEENNEEHADSNKDSLPIIPLGIKPPTLNSIQTNDTSAKCTYDFCQLLVPCDRNSTCITLPRPSCVTKCLPLGSDVTLKTIGEYCCRNIVSCMLMSLSSTLNSALARLSPLMKENPDPAFQSERFL